MPPERKTSWAVSGPNLFARRDTEQSAIDLAKLYANRHIAVDPDGVLQPDIRPDEDLRPPHYNLKLGV